MNKGQRREKADLLNTAERRAFVFKLRLAGVAYREIAEQTTKKFGAERLPLGWNGLYACKDIGRELKYLRDKVHESAVELRQVQDERLSTMLMAMWQKAALGDKGAVDRVLRIMERRAKLWGLDAPTRQDVTSGGEPISVVYSGNASPDEL